MVISTIRFPSFRPQKKAVRNHEIFRSWTPAIQSLCDVVWIRGAALRRACYALLSVWCPRGVKVEEIQGKSMGNPWEIYWKSMGDL